MMPLPSLRLEPMRTVRHCEPLPQLLPSRNLLRAPSTTTEQQEEEEGVTALKRLRADPQQQQQRALAGLQQMHGLTLRSSLNADQMAALAMATGESFLSPSMDSYKLKQAWEAASTPAEAPEEPSEDWKKARRKEQCRINQANYRKRKRQYEQRVAGEIKALEQEISQLERRRTKDCGRVDPIHLIADFYYAVGVEGEQQQKFNLQNTHLADGSSPALQFLMDLQREEFDSIESLKLHWMWYREQFRTFQLSIASCERLEAGEQVIIKFKGKLLLDVYYDHQKGEASSGYGAISCPITQQFEFEAGESTFTRITSEVDLIGGVIAAQDQSSPDCALSVLRCLAEGFSMTLRYHTPV
ncbi:hypothetical protein PHYBOEH_002009 [Phytophthora boehmeriae]|uniref:BZIP domain-containing protein n=1 Tax=Phytophthora boehmeriae TaxID=109152 RepID=A0A8T1V4C6_9STRA|nr:hypothetical protein PHYBOEH_002009 [Phytophthora boehmeriae]